MAAETKGVKQNWRRKYTYKNRALDENAKSTHAGFNAGYFGIESVVDKQKMAQSYRSGHRSKLRYRFAEPNIHYLGDVALV